MFPLKKNDNLDELLDEEENMEKIGLSLASAISSDRNRIGLRSPH